MNNKVIVAWQARDGYHKWQECDTPHVAELALQNAKEEGAQLNVWVFEVSAEHKGAEARQWVESLKSSNI